MKKQIFSLAIFILLLAPFAARAEWQDDLPDGLRINGRYFFAGAYAFNRPEFGERNLGEFNLRFNGSYNLENDWKLEFAYQADGTYLRNISLLANPGDDALMDMSWQLENKPNWVSEHGFDRLDLRYNAGDFTLDIGRQRIAWGTTLSMSFMDMFNPIRPGDPFVPEQPGTDAVRLQIPTGSVSGFDFLYAFLDEDREAFAARYNDTYGDFESGISTGEVDGEFFAAFETSGDVNDIGIRIEAVYRDTDEGNPVQVAFESDYAPNSSTYISGEILFNGPGASSTDEYGKDYFLGGYESVLYPAKLYAAVTCSYNPGGLSNIRIIGIANLTDDSWFADMSVSHSVSDNTDLIIGYQHYEGAGITVNLQGISGSQYGSQPDLIYMITTTYF